MRIHEALDIPEVTDLDQFITRLDTTDEDRVRRDMQQFVVADQVFDRIDQMLRSVGERFAQGLDMGRYIYGTFGSGKSHLMAVLGKMFERDERVYELGDPALSRLRGNHPWIDRRKTLVVRLNMMGKKTLVHALYEAFNAALPHDAERLAFTDQERVFELIERDAEKHYGGMDALLEQLVKDGVLPRAEFYDRGRGGDLDKQLDLAARLFTWRNHGQAHTTDDLWVDGGEGFHRIAAHAQSLGYEGIVWLVDELIIWIRGKARQEYVEQINALSSLVDHDARYARPIPFFVAVADDRDFKRPAHSSNLT